MPILAPSSTKCGYPGNTRIGHGYQLSQDNEFMCTKQKHEQYREKRKGQHLLESSRTLQTDPDFIL